jgi:hypothetical protein
MHSAMTSKNFSYCAIMRFLVEAGKPWRKYNSLCELIPGHAVYARVGMSRCPGSGASATRARQRKTPASRLLGDITPFP